MTDDNTCHVDSFIVDGLHADQDGDEVSIYFLESIKRGCLPIWELKNAIVEMRNENWRYGKRHNFFYEPKMAFSPFHKMLMQGHNQYLMKHSALWRTIEGSISNKCKIIMNLGCSI